MRALAEWWLYNVHKHAVRPSSWAKAEDRVRRIKSTLGELPVVDLDYPRVTEWQATLGRTLAPWTVRHHRQTLAQVVDEAVKMGAVGEAVADHDLRWRCPGPERDAGLACCCAGPSPRGRGSAAVTAAVAGVGGVGPGVGGRRPRRRHGAGAAGVGLRRRTGTAARAAQDRGGAVSTG